MLVRFTLEHRDRVLESTATDLHFYPWGGELWVLGMHFDLLPNQIAILQRDRRVRVGSCEYGGYFISW